MTIIAYRDGVMAADMQASKGDSKMGTVRKIGRNTAGDLAGVAGDAARAAAFLRWFEKGEEGPQPTLIWEKDGGSFDRALIVRKAGEPYEIYEPSGMFLMYAAYTAIGSGTPEAMGAMHHGATAEEAVAAAIAHDVHCGGDTTVLTHD